MTRIGVISDTHSYIDDKIIGYFNDCDQIWHAGDVGNEEVLNRLAAICELKAVFGNIDDHRIRAILPETQNFIVEESKVIITHIAGYPGKYNGRAQQLIAQHQPDFFVCGHSHILKVIYDKKWQHLHINPGAGGKSGFHRIQTLVRFNLDGKKASKMEIIEMKR